MTLRNPFLLCYTSLIPELYSAPDGTYALNATAGLDACRKGLKRPAHPLDMTRPNGPPDMTRPAGPPLLKRTATQPKPEQDMPATMTPSRRFVVSVPTPSPRPLRSILKPPLVPPRTHRDESLLPGDAQDGVVRPGSARGRVDKHVNILVDNERRGGLAEHDVQVLRTKHRLSRVECQPR